MELYVVVHQQAHPLHHVRGLRDLALVFQQVSHHGLDVVAAAIVESGAGSGPIRPTAPTG
jgi:hypothetical protein